MLQAEAVIKGGEASAPFSVLFMRERHTYKHTLMDFTKN